MERKLITNAVKYQRPVYEHLLYDSINRDDGSTVYRLHSDVFLLFNQQRLDTLGSDTAKKVVESYNNREFSNSSPKVSDIDLLETTIPRHMQSTSELKQISKAIETATSRTIDITNRDFKFKKQQADFDKELQEFKNQLKNVVK